ncbi:transaldolase family protein [Dongia soli]
MKFFIDTADIGTDGLQLIADVVQIYNAYPDFETQVLVASVRHPIHVIEAAKMGADVATLPPSVLRQMFNHPAARERLGRVPGRLGQDGAINSLMMML